MSTKLNSQALISYFEKWKKQIDDEIYFGRQPFSKSEFDYTLRKLIDYIPLASANYGLFLTPKISRFDISSQIRVSRFESDAALAEALDRMPLEEYPNYLRNQRYKCTKYKPQMVNLEEVVGAIGVKRWSEISTSEGRGLSSVKNMVENISQGFFDPINPDQSPIKLLKTPDGKYFVETDGRHRIAALKVMGVKYIPALVSEYYES